MIDHETPDDVLSDDAIVLKLKQANVDIARRTVAKYQGKSAHSLIGRAPARKGANMRSQV